MTVDKALEMFGLAGTEAPYLVEERYQLLRHQCLESMEGVTNSYTLRYYQQYLQRLELARDQILEKQAV